MTICLFGQLILKAIEDYFFKSFSKFFFFKVFIYLAALGLSCGTWDLVPWAGIKPQPPALGARSLTHWTPREVPPPPTLTPQPGLPVSNPFCRNITSALHAYVALRCYRKWYNIFNMVHKILCSGPWPLSSSPVSSSAMTLLPSLQSSWTFSSSYAPFSLSVPSLYANCSLALKNCSLHSGDVSTHVI